MTTTTLPAIGSAVHGHSFGKSFMTGYVRDHRGDDVVVEVVHGHRDMMGRRTLPAAWVTVDAEVIPAVVDAAARLTGIEVTVTLRDGGTATGTAAVDRDLIWINGPHGGSGYEPVEVRAITVGGA